MVVTHGRDLAREMSMMNNDGGVMEEWWFRVTKVSVYFQGSVKSAVITLKQDGRRFDADVVGKVELK